MRSLLFAPASRPDVLAKLPRSAPDAVAIDLEDAVAPNAKVESRVHAAEAGRALAAENPAMQVWIRLNATRSEWFAGDVADGLVPGIAGVIVPKIETLDDIDLVRAALMANDLDGLGIMAGLETALGVADSRLLLAADGITAAYFGAEDFTADIGGARRDDSVEVLYARSQVALSARLAGVHVFDQVVTALDDTTRFLEDAALGRALGYGGKLCIHPGQVAPAHQSFSPSPDDVDRAERLLEAYDAAAASGESAIAFEGQMVDEPLAQRARAVIAAAQGD